MQLPEHLVLYDGHCHLCDKSVKTILRFDNRAIFRFASLQSKLGKSILEKYHFNNSNGESIVYIRNNKILSKSEAALWISIELDFPINLLGGLVLFPPFIRNLTYDHIAKNRYKWFGKSENCLVPDAKFNDRFLDL